MSQCTSGSLSRWQEVVVRLFIDHDVDINAQSHVIWGNTLQIAIANADEDLVRLLLDRRADINAGNALITAVAYGDEDVVRLLLSRSANINPKGGCHTTALKTAEKNHHQAVIRLLLERGITSSASDDKSCGSDDEDDNGDDDSGNMSREDWGLLK
jgi:ankyrin repeat protein